MNTLNRIASAFVLSLIATAVVHADAIQPKSLVVQFADLDLSKPEAAVTLLGRIKGAARGVCSSLSGTSIRQKQEYKACVDFALSNAVAHVDQPVLTSYLAARSMKPTQDALRVADRR